MATRKETSKKFDGKVFTLYSSGTKKKVSDYLKRYKKKLPKTARFRIVKLASGGYGLYIRHKK